MWGMALIVAAGTLGLIAVSFAIGAPLLAVPIAILGVVAIGGSWLRRSLGHRRAPRESVEFTPRDKETLVSE
jgi:hypothetical protein